VSVWPAGQQASRCVAFSPYVAGYNPNSGPHPPPALIDTLLDITVSQLGFRCILVYGVLNGLDYVAAAAQARGIEVMQNIWLDSVRAVNDESITRGIQVANQYPGTVTRVSCGSEVRVRHGVGVAETEIGHCIDRLRAALVAQPIGSMDGWWNWCNASMPCQRWGLADRLDWVGINVYPWWENVFSGLYPCTCGAGAPDFVVARQQELRARYPERPVLLTEFGWPAGPEDYCPTSPCSGRRCGAAGEQNQAFVIPSTRRRLHALDQTYVVFEAFRGPWKTGEPGGVGPYWGLCQGTPPYTCDRSFADGFDADPPPPPRLCPGEAVCPPGTPCPLVRHGGERLRPQATTVNASPRRRVGSGSEPNPYGGRRENPWMRARSSGEPWQTRQERGPETSRSEARA
jgi:exo-beta-1,3-glucanase (GH17 family)